VFPAIPRVVLVEIFRKKMRFQRSHLYGPERVTPSLI